MPATILKRFVVFVFATVCVLFARAQQIRFIYLQTEGGQPFYAKLNNKVVSSSQTGYLILPKLSDGEYNVKVGFPKNEFPEENFKISIDKKNEGFLLKNFNNKGWGLFNMESFNVVMGDNTVSPANNAKNMQDDPFSKMLANVVKDSTILQKDEPEKETTIVAKIDSLAKTDSSVVTKPEPSLFSPATRLLKKKNSDGMEMVYVDHNNKIDDTIRIFIPVEKAVINKNSQNDIAQIEKPKIDSARNSIQDSLKDSPLGKDSVSKVNIISSKVSADTTTAVVSEMSPKNILKENKDTLESKKDIEQKSALTEFKDSSKVEKQIVDNPQSDIVILPKVVKSSSINSDCKAFADDEDFLKLRKKMASENSNDNMIKAAKKAFHTKCYSTEQIKNLSFLFLTDEGKYIFFDAAYASASDSDQYSTLQSQLTDSYYVNRFKAMIHK